MSTKQIFIVALVATSLLIGALVYFSLYRPTTIQIGEAPRPETKPSEISPSPPAPPQPSVRLTVKDNKTLIVEWEHLPSGTELIEILRRRLGSTKWTNWKNIRVSGNLERGSAEITITDGSSPYDYSYTFNAVGGGGGLWVSPVSGFQGNQTSTTPIVTGGGTTTGGSTGTPTSTGGSQTTTTLETGGGPTSTGQTGGQTPTSTVNDTSTLIYYTPSGQISTTTASTGHTESFWVLHVNKRIEVGWQNMPSGTVKVITSRSLNSNGPWTKLIEQRGTFGSTPYVIQLLDNTITSDYYYKLDARASNDTILQTFGPLFLPGLLE